MEYKFDPIEHGKRTQAKLGMEKHYEWRKWIPEIPSLNFRSDWDVKIIPPYGGAIVRFFITKGEARVSIYLDCYDELAFVGEPYWEMYPSVDGDVSRHLMNETQELIKAIHESLEAQLVGGESNE